MIIRSQKHKIIISCEHGGNQVPPEYRKLFRGNQSVLQSHRGRDKGAMELAKELAAKIKAPLFSSVTTRLLVDLNRSLHHRNLFSEFTRGCDGKLKAEILAGFYYPYRKKLEDTVRKYLEAGDIVMHLSIHSFTPGLGKEIRRADIGLLYDPQRTGERVLCRNFQTLPGNNAYGLIVRRNYPYKGTADGLTTYLRKKFRGRKYLGIEIEINQKHANANRAHWNTLRKQIIDAVQLAASHL